MKFVIIDNQSHYVAHLKNILRKLDHPETSVWPVGDEVMTDWDQALNKLVELKGSFWNPSHEKCVLFLDLALDAEDRQYSEGQVKIRGSMGGALEAYVVIVTTLFGSRGQDLTDVVDDVLDEKEIDADPASAPAAVKSAMHSAIQHWSVRTKEGIGVSPPEWRWDDSSAARRVDAALGKALVSELVDAVAPNWGDRVVGALAGGYSGSYVLRVQGRDSSGSKSAICKVATESGVLEGEIASWQRAAQVYEAFVGLIPPFIDARPQKLGRQRSAWYVRQSAVPGETLETVLRQNVGNKKDKDKKAASLRHLFQRLRSVSAKSIESSSMERSVCPRLTFTAVDRDRLMSSLEKLDGIRRECVKRGWIKQHHLDDRTGELVSLVEEWDQRRKAKSLHAVAAYEQHGDLNARNIILAGNTPQLIDFARYDIWPAGYDASRLHLQSFVRVVDAEVLDSFPDRLDAWLRLLREPRSSNTKQKRFDEYGLFRNAIAVWRADIAAEFKARHPAADIASAMLLGRCYDAIRMISYQDISPFKRIAILRVATDAAERLALLD